MQLRMANKERTRQRKLAQAKVIQDQVKQMVASAVGQYSSQAPSTGLRKKLSARHVGPQNVSAALARIQAELLGTEFKDVQARAYFLGFSIPQNIEELDVHRFLGADEQAVVYATGDHCLMLLPRHAPPVHHDSHPAAFHPSTAVVIFQFGGVVFFQSSPAQEAALLNELRAGLLAARVQDRARSAMPEEEDELTIHDALTVDDGLMAAIQANPRVAKALKDQKPERLLLRQRPNSDMVRVYADGTLAVRSIDVRLMEVVARRLCQSVYLHYYSLLADYFVLKANAFILRELKEAKGSTSMVGTLRRIVSGRTQRPTQRLKQLLCEMMLLRQKISIESGLLNISRTAWESELHDRAWQGMAEELELEERLEALQAKLEPTQDHLQQLMDMQGAERGDRKEDWIVWLIVGEVVLSIAHLGFEGHLNFLFGLQHP